MLSDQSDSIFDDCPPAVHKLEKCKLFIEKNDDTDDEEYKICKKTDIIVDHPPINVVDCGNIQRRVYDNISGCKNRCEYMLSFIDMMSWLQRFTRPRLEIKSIHHIDTIMLNELLYADRIDHNRLVVWPLSDQDMSTLLCNEHAFVLTQDSAVKEIKQLCEYIHQFITENKINFGKYNTRSITILILDDFDNVISQVEKCRSTNFNFE